jgi:putative membrane protein
MTTSWRDWTWAPFVIAWLCGALALYVIGVWRLRGTHAVRGWEIACFGAAWTTLVVALLSPLDALSDLLFSAHMTQHELLMVVAAPLAVMGRPGVAWLWALPRAVRERLGRMARRPALRHAWHGLTQPVVVFVVHGIVLWAWHAPFAFEAALHDENVHGVQHFTFFATALLFWWALLNGRYGRLGYGIAVVYVFATSIHSSLLGALLTFAHHPLYPTHAARTASAGLDAVGDQRLAGLLMWIPAGAVLLVLALAIFAAWLGESGRRARINDEPEAV